MTAEQTSYRQIIKATSIFGGVQVITIIVGIIRSKVVAILLGPTGFGIISLLTTTVGLISGLTNFGLSTSAVRDIAEAGASGNEERIGLVATVLRRWVWITGLVGTVACLLLAPYLSRLTFGNEQYTTAFIWLSITLLINQLSAGQMVLLQGLRKLKYLANAAVTGSFLGLAVSLPIYYIWGIDGIVPAIVLTSLANLGRSWYFARKIPLKNVEPDWQTTVKEGKKMLSMGFMLSLSGLSATGVSFALRAFISQQGSVEDVGLYSAGFAIIGTYVGLVFSAMGTDYYPRLSEVSNDMTKAALLINQQAEVAILILAPILNLFIVFVKWVILILYSSQFLGVNEMIQWAALGFYFRALSWAVAFIFLAKSESRLFFWNEFSANLVMLLMNIAGYYLGGLTGLGISFVLFYVYYLLQVSVISKWRYGFIYGRKVIQLFVWLFVPSMLCLWVMLSFKDTVAIPIGTLITAFSGYYAFVELDRRIGIKNLLKRFRN